MKYSKEEIEFLAKSMYKAVRKALDSRKMDAAKEKSRSKHIKDALEDLEDPNYIAEAKESVPPRRLSNMNKSKGLDKLKKFKHRLRKKKKDRCWEGYEPTPGKKPYSEDSCRKK